MKMKTAIVLAILTLVGITLSVPLLSIKRADDSEEPADGQGNTTETWQKPTTEDSSNISTTPKPNSLTTVRTRISETTTTQPPEENSTIDPDLLSYIWPVDVAPDNQKNEPSDAALDPNPILRVSIDAPLRCVTDSSGNCKQLISDPSEDRSKAYLRWKKEQRRLNQSSLVIMTSD